MLGTDFHNQHEVHPLENDTASQYQSHFIERDSLFIIMSWQGNNRVATPPELNFTLKTESDFNNQPHDWPRNEIQSQLPTDILLITANIHESSACYSYMKPVRQWYCKKLRRCVYFGQFGDNDDQNVKVALMKCELGYNEGKLAMKNAAEILKPKIALFVGTCASKEPEKVKY
ncbi:5 -methylthioadenosine S-adenosylhomocysteine nucleosidase [Paramuricea clavata]|uniref:5 -methylthioadenosine S-adenosylhomocysteine nucleosidase n=1 Tax=Paramuricea clavata TaxID=317549 RepID=A0A7D9IPC8_PARCT|nr:5 -methylthioadenosine S-adenosylhomocysteine nucleosidase [Paramuricea clavata]